MGVVRGIPLHLEPRRLLLPIGQMASSATNLGATLVHGIRGTYSTSNNI